MKKERISELFEQRNFNRILIKRWVTRKIVILLDLYSLGKAWTAQIKDRCFWIYDYTYLIYYIPRTWGHPTSVLAHFREFFFCHHHQQQQQQSWLVFLLGQYQDAFHLVDYMKELKKKCFRRCFLEKKGWSLYVLGGEGNTYHLEAGT